MSTHEDHAVVPAEQDGHDSPSHGADPHRAELERIAPGSPRTAPG